MTQLVVLSAVELLGRDAELSLVTDRLRRRRLVTLVGPGGIGKTTLARVAVKASEHRFPNGSRLIDLTRVDGDDAVPESIAAQLGYASYRALLDSPGDLPVLLLVDNCEHVVDAVAGVLEELLDACQMPTILATSRSSLELPDETVVPVGPLTLPPSGSLDSPAVDLFVRRTADAGVELEPDDTIAALCRRLDGVPLAIELAAARTRAMAPAEILARLGAGLDVLDRPRRRAARRHQSLRAAIGWSYDLLAPDEQVLFERLGVFQGPFTAELAHAVAGDPGTDPATTQDRLDALVATSMVVADPSGDTTWYRVLDTLRSFARDRLDARGTHRDVELRFVDDLVERIGDVIRRGASSWSADALAELGALYGNVAAAVRWCLAHDDGPERAYVFTTALWGLVHQAHTEEVGDLAQQVLERWPDDTHPMRSDTTATAATCRYMLGDEDGAIALAEGALDEADRSPFAPVTLRRALAQAHRAAGRAETSIDWFVVMAAHARRLGLAALATEADAARAQVYADLGRVDEALELVCQAGDEARAAGSELGAAWARSVEGSILLRLDPVRASTVIDEALAECRRLHYAAGTMVNVRDRALAALCRDDVISAARDTLVLLDELMARGSTYELRLVFDTASAVLARAGRTGPAAELAATALDLPVVSITASVGHELFPLEPGEAKPLPVRDAITLVRQQLHELVDEHEPSAPAPTRPAEAPSDDRVGSLHRVGDVWTITYEHTSVTVKATKGIDDLARLLASPGTEIHCLDLVGAAVDQASTGEVIDEQAKRAYEERIRELQAELDEAEADHDAARAERARAELDAVVDHLTAALGLGGRRRRTASAAERARSTVTQRVRHAIRRLGRDHPLLGRHLEASVRTGVYYSYQPERPVTWDVSH